MRAGMTYEGRIPTHGSASDGRTSVMFEEMQHSIVGQHMADLMREAAEARQDRELRQAARPTARPMLVRLGQALMAIGRLIGGESRETSEPPRRLSSDRASEPTADRTPRDVARAA
jgi:hypothetical protein